MTSKYTNRVRNLTKQLLGEADEQLSPYQKFFQGALEKFGASSPADLDDEKKKEFFDYVDKNWEADDEVAEGILPDQTADLEVDGDLDPENPVFDDPDLEDYEDATGQVSEDTLAGWIAIFNGKKLEIRKGQDAKDLWGAKEYAIKKLNVPKSKQGLLAVEPAYESIQREDGHSEEDELREMIRRELRKMM